MPTDHLHLPALLIPLNIVLESLCKKPEQPENPAIAAGNHPTLDGVAKKAQLA
ncbi:MAG: hypothetical protein KDD10_22050 [Phaeodactylibacter sp.]|nr:hypothetical protein [Phaeodactylibacter sp.]MCB9293951.1 hypothetical protein [Lewinellaceae bacterium]